MESKKMINTIMYKYKPVLELMLSEEAESKEVLCIPPDELYGIPDIYGDVILNVSEDLLPSELEIKLLNEDTRELTRVRFMSELREELEKMESKNIDIDVGERFVHIMNKPLNQSRLTKAEKLKSKLLREPYSETLINSEEQVDLVWHITEEDITDEVVCLSIGKHIDVTGRLILSASKYLTGKVPVRRGYCITQKQVDSLAVYIETYDLKIDDKVLIHTEQPIFLDTYLEVLQSNTYLSIDNMLYNDDIELETGEVLKIGKGHEIILLASGPNGVFLLVENSETNDRKVLSSKLNKSR